MIHQYCPDIRKQEAFCEAIAYVDVEIVFMYVIVWDSINASELLYKIPDCFSIQERFIYTETRENNYFSDK